jgi:plastocyanin
MSINRSKILITASIYLLSFPQTTNSQEIVRIRISGPGANAEYILEGETEQSPVHVNVGQTVRWINDERPRHTATATGTNSSGDRLFNTGTLREGEEADVLMDNELFLAAGGTTGGTVELDYICAFHPQTMQGTIALKDVASTGGGILHGDGPTSTSSGDTAKILSVTDVTTTILESFPPQAIITAMGSVPSTAWTSPRLIPYIYVTPPADGIYEFDFVADRPVGISIPMTTPITAKHIYPDLTGVKGFRIYASSNNKQVLIGKVETERSMLRPIRRDRSAPAPDLPMALKSMLADEGLRLHHQLWHFVRSSNAWNNLPQASRQQLAQMGWQAPRFEDQTGAGLDFLFMHRQMIKMVNEKLATLNDPYWDQVKGWDPIPWAHDDSEWPVPDWPNPEQGAAWARDPATVLQMEGLEAQFRDPSWLRQVTLDELGTEIEFSIHAWMHLRWSGPPPADPDSTAPSNDWLFTPWSSHVNKHFWKLHGWIDERIEDWEAANSTTADFTNAWEGPPGVLPRGRHRANLQARNFIPSVSSEPLPMLPKAETIERLQKAIFLKASP